jgi:hypothetical protein
MADMIVQESDVCPGCLTYDVEWCAIIIMGNRRIVRPSCLSSHFGHDDAVGGRANRYIGYRGSRKGHFSGPFGGMLFTGDKKTTPRAVL